MFGDKKAVVVMSACNTEKTLMQIRSEVSAQKCLDLVIIVDGASRDGTIKIANGLPKTSVWCLYDPILKAGAFRLTRALGPCDIYRCPMNRPPEFARSREIFAPVLETG